jgi:uncharacterized protein YjdB
MNGFRILRRRTRVSLAMATALAILAGSCRDVAVTAVDIVQVTVEPATAQIAIGQSLQLSVRLTDASGRELSRSVSWSTSSAAVAFVSASGLVTATGSGLATITATAEGKSGEAQIAVVPKPVASIEIVPGAASLLPGDSIRLQALIKAVDGSTLTDRVPEWSSSDTRIATVRSDGTVRALAAGTAVVSATVEGVTGVATVTVRASSGLAVATVRVEPASATLHAGDTLRFRAVLTDISGQVLTGRIVTWSSSAAGIATVSEAASPARWRPAPRRSPPPPRASREPRSSRSRRPCRSRSRSRPLPAASPSAEPSSCRR